MQEVLRYYYEMALIKIKQTYVDPASRCIGIQAQINDIIMIICLPSLKKKASLMKIK